MDIALARTFLEIVETGSFVAAAGRLNITQTAVSARVHAMEEQLGRRLFVRNKSGARLTPAGERFLRHAATLVQVWDRARRQVALPPGRIDIASVGAEISLWHPLLVDWLAWMKKEAPDIALRAEVGTAGPLLEAVRNGALDLAVLYDPPPQDSTAVVELLHEEKLVMVTTDASGRPDNFDDYVQIDWGPSFQSSHQAAFPQLESPGMSVSHGPLALLYLLRVGGTGYFRLSAVAPYLERGQLHRVVSAPAFSYSVHMVYSSRTDRSIIDLMRRGLTMTAPDHGAGWDAVGGGDEG
ncbi:LysR family transcriptional regulator [Devosia honganensis]|uniref:LysR family transcriptional regulator n=1 Tax=Devosia honganensis TaxID=1610527 RepID=A0ABV7WWH1_9HYPH